MESNIKSVLEHKDPTTTVYIHGLKYEVDDDTQQACFFVDNIEENSKTIGGKQFLWQSQKWIVLLYDESQMEKKKKNKPNAKRTFRRRTKNENEGCSYEVTEVISLDVQEDFSGTCHLREYTWKPNVVNTDESFILVTYSEENDDIEEERIIPPNLSTSYVSNATHEDFEMTYDDANYDENLSEQPPVGAVAKLTYISEKLLHLNKVAVEEDEEENEEERYEAQPINIKMSFEPVVMWVSQYEGRYGLSTSHFQLSEQFGNSCGSQVLAVRTRGGYLSDFSLSFSEAKRSKRYRHRNDFKKPHYDHLPNDVIVIDRLDEEEQKQSSDDEGFEEIELEVEPTLTKISSSSDEVAASPQSNYGSYTSTVPAFQNGRPTLSSSSSEDATTSEDRSKQQQPQEVFKLEINSVNDTENDSSPDLAELVDLQSNFSEKVSSNQTIEFADEEVVSDKTSRNSNSNCCGDEKKGDKLTPIFIQNSVIINDVISFHMAVQESPKKRAKFQLPAAVVQEVEVEEKREEPSFQQQDIDFNVFHDREDDPIASYSSSLSKQDEQNECENFPIDFSGHSFVSEENLEEDDLSDLADLIPHNHTQKTSEIQIIHEEKVLPKQASNKRSKTQIENDERLHIQPIRIECKPIHSNISLKDGEDDQPIPCKRPSFTKLVVHEEDIQTIEKSHPVLHEEFLRMADPQQQHLATVTIDKVGVDELSDFTDNVKNASASEIKHSLTEELIFEKPMRKDGKLRQQTDVSMSPNAHTDHNKMVTETKLLGADVHVSVVADENLPQKARTIKKDLVYEDQLQPVASKHDNQEPDFNVLCANNLLSSEHEYSKNDKPESNSDILIRKKNEPLPDELSEFNIFQCKGIKEKNTVTKTEKLEEENIHEKTKVMRPTRKDELKKDENVEVKTPIPVTSIQLSYVQENDDDIRDKPTFRGQQSKVSEDEIQQTRTISHVSQLDMIGALDFQNRTANTLSDTDTNTHSEDENLSHLLPEEEVVAKVLPAEEPAGNMLVNLSDNEKPKTLQSDNNISPDTDKSHEQQTFLSAKTIMTKPNIDAASEAKLYEYTETEVISASAGSSISPDGDHSTKADDKPLKKSMKTRAKKMILKPFKSSKKSSKDVVVSPDSVSSNDSTTEIKKKKVRSKFSLKRNGSQAKTIDTNKAEVKNNKSKKSYQRSETTTPTIAARITLLREHSRDNLFEKDDKETRSKVRRSRSFDSILSAAPNESSIEQELKERRRRLAGYIHMKPGKHEQHEIVKGRQYTADACEKETMKEINLIREQRQSVTSNKSMTVSMEMLQKAKSVGTIHIPEVFQDKLSNEPAMRTNSVGRIVIPQAFSVENINKLSNTQQSAIKPAITEEMLI